MNNNPTSNAIQQETEQFKDSIENYCRACMQCGKCDEYDCLYCPIYAVYENVCESLEEYEALARYDANHKENAHAYP